MNIIELKEKENTSENVNENVKLGRLFAQFQELLKELRERQLPDEFIETVNQGIEEINSTPLVGKDYRKLINRKQLIIMEFLEKKLNIVPKNHYRNQWMSLGMSLFGLPWGVVLSIITNNWAFVGIGLPFGMGIGILVGSKKDKEAFKEGRQLKVELRY
jgi:hypothetical protein